MDLSKAERQAPAEQRRSKDSPLLRTLLQDILCFFVLLSLALLIVAAILCVVHNATRVHHQRQHRQGNQDNGSRRVCRCFRRGSTWLRFFNCQNKQPQQDTRLEQVQEPERDPGQEQPVKPHPFDTQLAPTHHPEQQRLQAGGDHIEAGATGSEPQSILAGEQWPPLGYRNLMQLILR